MIESLYVHGYQKHLDTLLEFSPGVNVLMGESDTGKSSLIRAILWIITNRPQGFEGLRHWDLEKGESVKAEIIVDGMSITRERSEDVNQYIVNETQYKAMGSSVPEEIAAILNMGPVNLQSQHTTHYLLSASSGEVARTLNDACDLSVIDKTIKGVSKIRDEAKSQKALYKERIENAEEELASLEWVAGAESKLARIEEQQCIIDERSILRSRQLRIVGGLEEVEEELERASEVLKVWDALPTVERAVEDVDRRRKTCTSLRSIITELDEIEESKGVDRSYLLKDILATESAFEKLEEKRKVLSLLSDLLDQIEENQQKLKSAEHNHEQTNKEMTQAWIELESCPLCDTFFKRG